jgi:hypothetical protein
MMVVVTVAKLRELLKDLPQRFAVRVYDPDSLTPVPLTGCRIYSKRPRKANS